MTVCMLIQSSIHRSYASLVSEEEQAVFVFQCREFALRWAHALHPCSPDLPRVWWVGMHASGGSRCWQGQPARLGPVHPQPSMRQEGMAARQPWQECSPHQCVPWCPQPQGRPAQPVRDQPDRRTPGAGTRRVIGRPGRRATSRRTGTTSAAAPGTGRCTCSLQVRAGSTRGCCHAPSAPCASCPDLAAQESFGGYELLGCQWGCLSGLVPDCEAAAGATVGSQASCARAQAWPRSSAT